VRGFELRGEGLRGGGVVGVVDGDVAALGGEGAGDFGAETSEGDGKYRLSLNMAWKPCSRRWVIDLATAIGTTAPRHGEWGLPRPASDENVTSFERVWHFFGTCLA
jgi:hypothetical protein